MRPLLGLLFAFALGAAACGSDSGSLAADAENAASDVSAAAGDVDTSGLDAEAMQAGSNLQAQLNEADLSTLFSAMNLVGFDDLEREDAFTFFAPNDSAFAAIDADQLSALMADPAGLGTILKDHLVTETLMANDLTDGTLTSDGGLELVIDTSGPIPTVNGIEIVRTDLTVGNGVVHVIDGVLLRGTK